MVTPQTLNPKPRDLGEAVLPRDLGSLGWRCQCARCRSCRCEKSKATRPREIPRCLAPVPTRAPAQDTYVDGCVCVWCSWSSLSGRSVATALRMETPLPRPCFGRDNSLNINFLVLGCIGVLRGLIYRIIIPPLFVCHRLQQPMISEQQSYQSRDVSTSKLHQLCSCVALCAAFIYDLECVC